MVHKHNSLAQNCSKISVMIAVTISLIKLIGWAFTGSLSILAALTDSLMDIVSSLINFLALRYAHIPADNFYRFGRSKVEDLAVFSQSSFFTLSGFLIGVNALKRLYSPEKIENNDIGIIVIVISTILTFILVQYQKRVIKDTGSKIIIADHLHYQTDLFMNVSVITSLIFAKYLHNYLIDPLLALFISFYMIYTAWHMLKNAFQNLLDHEFDEKDKNIIKEIIKEHEKVTGIHDFKTRIAGSKRFVQFHLEMNGQITLHEAHNISNEIENKIFQAFDNEIEIIIHQDPDDIHEEIKYTD